MIKKNNVLLQVQKLVQKILDYFGGLEEEMDEEEYREALMRQNEAMGQQGGGLFNFLNQSLYIIA